MGGCVSVEGAYHKLLGNNLKTYKVRRTEIIIVRQTPLASLSNCLAVPVYADEESYKKWDTEQQKKRDDLRNSNLDGTSYMAPGIGGTGDESAILSPPIAYGNNSVRNSQLELSKLPNNTTTNLAQTSRGRRKKDKQQKPTAYDMLVDPTSLELKEKEFKEKQQQFKAILTPEYCYEILTKKAIVCETASKSLKLSFSLKHVVFVHVMDMQPDRSFTREILSDALIYLLEAADSQGCETLTIPKLHRSSTKGIILEELAMVTMQTIGCYFQREPSFRAGSRKLEQVFLTSSDEQYTRALITAMEHYKQTVL